ncbi:hypothetical protein [Qipengyuania atrilutea]|uniref:Uncharacterized protein n=1 Tax=Qipengyuania atrilutea TaxID=2744473 RepID=A0A850H2P6_9SPHN|nr:hypothetical protein [Actirhodobacter atriluteus]NVD44850.1 hypothetical protein [Actirhodobacter atriluteus]
MQIDFEALAEFAETTFDFDERFEDDEFGCQFDGMALFVTRTQDCFRIEANQEVLELPR